MGYTFCYEYIGRERVVMITEWVRKRRKWKEEIERENERGNGRGNGENGWPRLWGSSMRLICEVRYTLVWKLSLFYIIRDDFLAEACTLVSFRREVKEFLIPVSLELKATFLSERLPLIIWDNGPSDIRICGTMQLYTCKESSAICEDDFLVECEWLCDDRYKQASKVETEL